MYTQYSTVYPAEWGTPPPLGPGGQPTRARGDWIRAHEEPAFELARQVRAAADEHARSASTMSVDEIRDAVLRLSLREPAGAPVISAEDERARWALQWRRRP